MKATYPIEGLTSLGTKVKLFEVKENAEIEIKILKIKIEPVPHTMKIHQVTVTDPQKIMARELSCFCSFGCQCFDPWITHYTSVREETSTVNKGSADGIGYAHKRVLKPVVSYDESLLGQYVVVTYDNIPFPGLILDVDEGEIEVKVMHRVGTNRYFWPLIEDRLWYQDKHVVTLLASPPEPVTKRHCQIDLDVWREIAKALDV